MEITIKTNNTGLWDDSSISNCRQIFKNASCSFCSYQWNKMILGIYMLYCWLISQHCGGTRRKFSAHRKRMFGGLRKVLRITQIIKVFLSLILISIYLLAGNINTGSQILIFKRWAYQHHLVLVWVINYNGQFGLYMATLCNKDSNLNTTCVGYCVST